MAQDPDNRVKTFVYDGGGRLSSVASDEGRHMTFSYTSPAGKEWRAANRGTAPAEPAPSPAPVFTRTFEYRLSGSEAQEQTVAIPGIATGEAIAATGNVQAYLTRRGEAVAPSDIGGIEVTAAALGGQLVCGVRLTDFSSGDLVVVRVDVAVYLVR